jgi:valacyclovir hydrolase
MAIRFQSSINKAVVWGGNAYCLPREKKALHSTKNIQVWNPKVREGFLKVYGNELQTLWEKHVNHYINNLDDICRNDVKKIQCPVLILHGDMDPLIPLEHPNYLLSQIPDSRLHRFAKGSHNIHQQFTEEFNRIVQEFLLE